jgi:hypothetical protein
MLRRWTYACLAIIPLVAAPAARAEITLGVSVGFASGNAGPASKIFKQGCWTPVYVQITNGAGAKAETISSRCTVVVQMTDSDGMDSQFVGQVPADITPGSPAADVMVLARPVSANEEIVVSVLDPEGHTLVRSSVSLRNMGHLAVANHNVLCLALGSPLPSLDAALRGLKTKEADEGAVVAESRTYNSAFLTKVPDMPRRWFGYQGVDMIVLTTGTKQFIEELVDPVNKYQLDAIRDWVRHGGRIVISMGGSNFGDRIALLNKLNVIDVIMQKDAASWKSLDSVLPWVRNAVQTKPGIGDLAGQDGKPLDVAWFKIKPDSLHRPITDVKRPRKSIDEAPELVAPNDRPLIVEAPYGLGRVLLIAFELDDAPFTKWEGQEAFWQNLQKGLKLVPQVADTDTRRSPTGYLQEQDSDLNTKLLRGLETIEDVPVVSFGWVALFILLYILVVGPLDYFFLKKVVKRLELSWITFPVIVITISVAAYVVAYLLKGNDLKINKLDVVDIFLDADTPSASGEPAKDANTMVARDAVGTTWFTLFSPQIKRYTIGVDLNRGSGRTGDGDSKRGWISGPADLRDGTVYGSEGTISPYGLALGTMYRPENFPEVGQRGAGGLFRWPCRYEEDGSGMTSVPIQVWQTKTFTASWQASLADNKKLITAQLAIGNNAGGETELKGWIESGLPVPLTDVVLLYNERAYELNALTPGQQKEIQQREAGGANKLGQSWLQEAYTTPYFKSQTSRNRYQGTVTQDAPCAYAKAIMFGVGNTNPQQSLTGGGFRNFDQSWRLKDPQRNKEEAILVGRVAPGNGPAEEIAGGLSCPTRLWLDRLPKAGGNRPTLSGKLTQDTIVRVFIPVAQPKKQ